VLGQAGRVTAVRRHQHAGMRGGVALGHDHRPRRRGADPGREAEAGMDAHGLLEVGDDRVLHQDLIQTWPTTVVAVVVDGDQQHALVGGPGVVAESRGALGGDLREEHRQLRRGISGVGGRHDQVVEDARAGGGLDTRVLAGGDVVRAGDGADEKEGDERAHAVTMPLRN